MLGRSPFCLVCPGMPCFCCSSHCKLHLSTQVDVHLFAIVLPPPGHPKHTEPGKLSCFNPCGSSLSWMMTMGKIFPPFGDGSRGCANCIVGCGKVLRFFTDQLRGLGACDGWQWITVSMYDNADR